jgi:predicted nucleic acid-binding protein
MTLYAESSALLAWLLAEDSGEAVRAEIQGASAVASSRITLVECERGLSRAVLDGRASLGLAGAARAALAGASVRWTLADVTEEILDRARRPFPHEPVRTLDALHLATLVLLQPRIPDLAVLSVDDRVRRNAQLLGVPVRPA